MEEYFEIILGGMFEIATIVVAVTALGSNIINEKCLNIYVNKMWRYRITFNFIPIYYMIVYGIALMKWEYLRYNRWCILVGVGSFLCIITYCSYLTAQYLTNTKKFQQKVLKISLKNLKKEIKNNKDKDAIIVDYIREVYRSINTENCRIFQSRIDRKKLYSKYLEVLDPKNINDQYALKLFKILNKEFDIEETLEICSNFSYGQMTYILLVILNEQIDPKIFNECIQRVHSYYKYGNIMDQQYFKYKSIILCLNNKAMLMIPQYLVMTLEYLNKTDFIIKDACYLSIIIDEIFALSKVLDFSGLKLKEEVRENLKKILNSKEDYKWQDNNNEKDEAIQTALIMLKESKNEK